MIASLLAKLAFGKLLGGAVRGLAIIIKAIWESVCTLLSSPAVWLAVAVVGATTYGLGINRGMKIDAHLVQAAKHDRDQWKAAHKQLIDDAKRLDDANKDKLKDGLAAKSAAEKAVDGAAAPAVSSSPVMRKPAKRAAPKSQDDPYGPFMQWLQSLQGGSGKG